MAQKLGTINIGNSSKPIYLEGGTPKECVDFLPLTAGQDKKLTGPLGLTENVNYGVSLPDNGFVGQLFFLEEEEEKPSLPTGGTAGQVLVKNSATDGDASWATNISGNAATATKLATARTIASTGDVVSSGTFDGSGNLSLSSMRRGCSVGQSSSTSTNSWYKFASLSASTIYTDSGITFKVTRGYGDYSTNVGVLTAHFRTDANGYWESGELEWEYAASGIDVNKFVLAYNNSTSPIIVELWCKCDTPWAGYHFDVIAENNRIERKTNYWTLYNTWSAGSASDITSGYTQITSTLSTLKNSISGNAATATKATQDGNGKVISSTYLPLSGGTLTGTLNMQPSDSSNTMDLLVNDFGTILACRNSTTNNGAGLLISESYRDLAYAYYTASTNSVETHKLWKDGDAVTGAVWNDYAECRESDCEEFGYVLMETGDDSLTKTTERLSHFAGVSSDTWGFSQGETTRARTPIAVAGRVLVYPYQDRNNYKPGDCVCAAPGGTVDIMTREEVREWPDRIVGTVSCVPNYEEWGGGEGADRNPVKINGRIWIKVR